MKTKIILGLIVTLAFALRVFGFNWDQSHHLHPDERFMTMVVSAVEMPTSVANYFSQKTSALNPYNHGFNFYVYGTFPLLATRFFGEAFGQTGYDDIFLVGRWLSATFDVLTLMLVYRLALLLFKNHKAALLTGLFYALSVFPIQQAHFFTVDAFTVFFSTLTLLLTVKYVEKKSGAMIFLAGAAFGLTLANKTSIGITLPAFLAVIWWGKKFARQFRNTLFFLAGGAIAFRLFQPYAFDGLWQIFPHFLQNIAEAHKMITGEIDYPPNIQWAYTQPLLHPLANIFFWGLGPVISLLALAGIFLSLKNVRKITGPALFLLLAFAAVIFVYQGIQLAKYMRYFYPLYPILAIFAGLAAAKLTSARAVLVLIIATMIWPLAFLAIYSRPHSRVLASQWIYENIPAGAKITSEEWDDGLPLPLPGTFKNYVNLPLGLYNTETLAKWQKVAGQLSEANYIIMSSNRLFGSIPRLPARYPVTSLYYRLLFQEKLGFKKVAEITSYPCLGTLCLPDGRAEESFTVYDHPQIVIFQKKDFTASLLAPLLDKTLIDQAKNINPNLTNTLF